MPLPYLVPSPARLYRVNFGPDPLRLRDWSAATVVGRLGSRTFGHRWDDPQGQFRSLYCSDSPLGAVIEFMQGFVPRPSTIRNLRDLRLQPGESLVLSGALPPDFFEHYYLCTLTIDPAAYCVDVLHHHVIDSMRLEHGALANALGVREITAGTMLGPHFELTQAIARSLFYIGFAGVTALSKFGKPHNNWTLFEDEPLSERFRVNVTLADVPVRLSQDDAHVTEALEVFGL